MLGPARHTIDKTGPTVAISNHVSQDLPHKKPKLRTGDKPSFQEDIMSKVTVNRGSSQSSSSQYDSHGYKRIGQSERVVSMIAGTTLASSAMRSRSLVSAAILLGVSAGLLHRGATGKCGFAKGADKLSSMLNNKCEQLSDRVNRHQSQRHDQVAQSSEDSFPASDSPSFTPVTGESPHATHMNQ